MSKPDKHTPLSPEELFKLLEDHSGKATDFDGMDDFEKEALEGFTKFSSPEKAMAMVEEVNLAVSKKVASGTSATKRKVIWFSAAASIVLLVMISVFFLNQSKEDSASNVAIMDLTPPPTVQPTLEAPQENVTGSEPIMDEQKEAAKPAADVTISGKAAFKQDLANRMETQTANPVSGISKEVAFAENKPVAEESEKVSGTSGNIYTYKGNTDAKDVDALKKNEFEATDKLAAVQPVATKNQTETTTAGYYSPSAGSNNNTSSVPVTTIEQGNSKNDDKVLAEKAAKETTVERAGKKSKEREESKAKQKSPAYTTAESEMDQEVESAYYKGGELAIKEYVLAYVQKTGAGITGKYKVKATVLATGMLKVKFVNHITTEVCKDCENVVKKALNEMSGWTPAMWGKTASESSVDFVLSF